MADAPRVFWLGMHKVLKPTELKRLRALGLEVFNPAYISPIYDQSADLRIDFDQETTLPNDVFAKLISYDFFYRPIASEIAEILNSYFDVVIVTINGDWLREVLKVFTGRVIYRVFGQHFLLSDHLLGNGSWDLMNQRDNVSIIPFARESIADEHRWFQERVAAVVPYQIPDDVFSYPGRWGEATREEIATSFPNVENPYYAAAYRAFNNVFPESYFRIYGPQRSHPADRRIVNTLPREALFDGLRHSAGYYYDYKDSVCYLPPIESMQLGVPVVCARGSLLADFLGLDSPNVAHDTEHVRKLLRMLLRRDRVLADELLAAQESTRRRYDREVVGPEFDLAFKSLLLSEETIALPKTVAVRSRWSQRIAIPLHIDGLFRHLKGNVYAFEGIPRVIDTVVRNITANSDIGCVISCTRASRAIMQDLFSSQIAEGSVALNIMEMGHTAADDMRARLKLVEAWQQDQSISTILIPHYYLFPEFMLAKKRLAMYLPDYFPHLQPGVIFDQSLEKDQQNKAVGVHIAKHASAILTNSGFTRRYLPDAGFVGEAEMDKIIVAPLPFLGEGRALDPSREEVAMVLDHVGQRPFLFYPTANRPNKRLDFLLDLYAELLLEDPTLGLVLTCSIDSHRPVAEKAIALGLNERITYIHHASEGMLRWLYRNARLLCLTSVVEGNFPPQVLEALNYGTPVVSTRLPTVVEILGDNADELLLCRPLDREDFLSKIRTAITSRDAVLARQAGIVARLKQWNSQEAFTRGLSKVFPEMTGSAVSVRISQCA